MPKGIEVARAEERGAVQKYFVFSCGNNTVYVRTLSRKHFHGHAEFGKLRLKLCGGCGKHRSVERCYSEGQCRGCTRKLFCPKVLLFAPCPAAAGETRACCVDRVFFCSACCSSINAILPCSGERLLGAFSIGTEHGTCERVPVDKDIERFACCGVEERWRGFLIEENTKGARQGACEKRYLRITFECSCRSCIDTCCRVNRAVSQRFHTQRFICKKYGVQ